MERIVLRRTAGNQPVEMLQDLHSCVARPVSSTNRANLSIDCTVGVIPDFLIDTFYIIDNRATDAELWEQVIEYAGLEDEEDANGVVINPIRPAPELYAVPDELQFKRLINLMVLGKTKRGTSLMIAAALVGICDSNFTTGLMGILTSQNTNIQVCNLDEFVEIFGLTTTKHNQIANLRDLSAAHYVLSLCFLMNLLGKNISSVNYPEWKQRRLRSYAAPLMLTPNDPLNFKVVPPLDFAMKFYSEVRSMWQVRRRFFIECIALSRQPGLLGVGLSISANLLRGAEMTNLSMILLWIATLNPDLLFWNELAKYLPFLYAAYSRYKSFGANADWAKLLLPPDELKEFASDKLQVLYTVARAISQRYGSSSVANIEGTNEADGTTEIVRQALNIVKIAGGARTIDVMALRQWRYNGFTNTRLTEELNTGAGERLIVVQAVADNEENPDQRGIGALP